mmetsp:Transcript_25139/g.35221  ORF Transcript_25139/g.35221 Transcript_25139/m.35221 type:complete len:168 (-) Transcript_25139:27-530(-)
MAEKWGFEYVENIVWVKMQANNKLARQDHQYFKKSKSHVFIFRKGEKLELRHQRNPDVIFDFVRTTSSTNEEEKPEFLYKIIETLLPTACYNEQTKRGKLLELWAKKGAKRRGWTKVFIADAHELTLSKMEDNETQLDTMDFEDNRMNVNYCPSPEYYSEDDFDDPE